MCSHQRCKGLGFGQASFSEDHDENWTSEIARKFKFSSFGSLTSVIEHRSFSQNCRRLRSGNFQGQRGREGGIDSL